MNTYNFISLFVSTISLIISGLVAYLAYLKKSQPQILVGSNLILFNSFVDTISGKTWGGYIYEIRLIVDQKNNPNDYFDITWTNFVKFVDGINWENEDTAQPIAIPGRMSLTKFIRFDWSPLTGEKLKIKFLCF